MVKSTAAVAGRASVIRSEFNKSLASKLTLPSLEQVDRLEFRPTAHGHFGSYSRVP